MSVSQPDINTLCQNWNAQRFDSGMGTPGTIAFVTATGIVQVGKLGPLITRLMAATTKAPVLGKVLNNYYNNPVKWILGVVGFHLLNIAANSYVCAGYNMEKNPQYFEELQLDSKAFKAHCVDHIKNTTLVKTLPETVGLIFTNSFCSFASSLNDIDLYMTQRSNEG